MMYEISLNDTMAKEYALKYIQLNILYEFDKTDTRISFLSSKNNIEKIEQGNRFNFTMTEIFEKLYK